MQRAAYTLLSIHTLEAGLAVVWDVHQMEHYEHLGFR